MAFGAPLSIFLQLTAFFHGQAIRFVETNSSEEGILTVGEGIRRAVKPNCLKLLGALKTE